MPAALSTPLVSVIIPCFNHGAFIDEAIESVRPGVYNFDVEIIIVDDGSTDAATKTTLSQLEEKGYTVLYQANAGPAAARNKGIAASVGKYILPLDADNKIKPEYIKEAVAVLEKKEFDVFYCAPVFFDEEGETSAKFNTVPFDLSRLLTENYIDACAVYSRTLWEKNMGYDAAIPYYGHEDWEFWLSAYQNGFRFYFSKSNLFFYRVSVNFVSSQFSNLQKVKDNQLYIVRKHAALFLQHYNELYYLKKRYKNDVNLNLLSGFVYVGYKLGLAASPFKKAAQKFLFKK